MCVRAQAESVVKRASIEFSSKIIAKTHFHLLFAWHSFSSVIQNVIDNVLASSFCSVVVQMKTAQLIRTLWTECDVCALRARVCVSSSIRGHGICICNKTLGQIIHARSAHTHTRARGLSWFRMTKQPRNKYLIVLNIKCSCFIFFSKRTIEWCLRSWRM